MAFTLHTEKMPELDAWLDEQAKAEGRSKQAITLAALDEYRRRRQLAHVLELGSHSDRDHDGLMDRLADA